MLKGLAKPLKASKSALKEPTVKLALISSGTLLASSLTHTVTLSCSLKTLPVCTKGLKAIALIFPNLVFIIYFSKNCNLKTAISSSINICNSILSPFFRLEIS